MPVVGSGTNLALTPDEAFPEELWYRALHPENADHGDPFVLVSPAPSDTSYAFYVYVTTGGDSSNGKAFATYGSRDLRTWVPLGRVLDTEEGKACWAPAVVYVPGLPRPYVMLYSQGAGSGELAHRNQRLYRADALQPEGPFVPSGHGLTPDLDFAIDPDLFELDDGSWRLICATDFDQPEDFDCGRCVGTGLAVGRLNRDLSEWLEPLVEMARASADWHVYQAERNDQHWKPWYVSGKPVRWYCMEAPATVDADNVIYSGGNYGDYYAMGVLHRGSNGAWTDRSVDQDSALLRPHPDVGLFGPGHGMVFRHTADGQPLLIFHARYGSTAAQRQFAIAPLFRTVDGALVCPPVPESLTSR